MSISPLDSNYFTDAHTMLSHSPPCLGPYGLASNSSVTWRGKTLYKTEFSDLFLYKKLKLWENSKRDM